MNENHFGSLIADSRCVETEILLLPPNVCAYRIVYYSAFNSTVRFIILNGEYTA